MKTLEKYPETKELIRFPDCDSFGHLNNARYIDYFMNAREDHLMKFYELNIYNYPKETGKAWVVAQNQIAYLRSALLMETVTIQSRLLNVGKKRLLVEMQMFNEDKTSLKAVIWAVFAHVDMKNQKSIEHAPDIMEFLKSVEAPIDNMVDFNQRVSELRNQFKPMAVA